MTVRVPVSTENNVVFDYEGAEFTISAPRWNTRALAYVVDITWAGKGIYGVFMCGGVDIIANMPHCPLPNLWAYNESNYIADITPDTISSLALVIRE